MAQDQYRQFSCVNITIGLLDNPLVIGVAAISYKRKKTFENKYLTGAEPVAEGEGKAEYECSITLDEVEVRKITAAIPAGYPKKLSELPPFTVTVSFRRGPRRVTDKVYNWRFLEDGVEAKEGDTGLLRTIASKCAGIDFGDEQ